MTKDAIVKSPSGRPTRAPVGRRNILSVKGKEPGYVYRIINDVDDRIELFKEAGWEVVLNSDVNVGDKRVNQATPVGSAATVSVGGGTKGVVVRIKEEWYNEDQQAKMRQVDEIEGSLRPDADNGADYGNLSIRRK